MWYRYTVELKNENIKKLLRRADKKGPAVLHDPRLAKFSRESFEICVRKLSYSVRKYNKNQFCHCFILFYDI